MPYADPEDNRRRWRDKMADPAVRAERRARDNAARKARRDAAKAAGTYKRPPDRNKVWADGRWVYLGPNPVPDPDDYSHPLSDVSVGP